MHIYYIPLHVSSTIVLIFRRKNCINTAYGIVTLFGWLSSTHTYRYMTMLFYCNIQSICTHASATLETLMLRRSSRCFNMAMWHLMASVGLAKSVSDVEGDMRPPATPSFKCRLLLSGLLTRQAFLMSTSVVFTQPGWNMACHKQRV